MASGDKARAGWYADEVQSVPESARRLLEEYSGLEHDEVLPHVLSIRETAFGIHSYACIGQMRFLSFNLSAIPCYETVVKRLQSGATLLDAGCCFGTEIRYLANEGIPSSQLFGFDLEPKFLDLGYDLFRDRGKLQATFMAGDILAPPTSPEGEGLTRLEGKIDIVWASSFLHVWDWDEMILAVRRLVSLTVPRPGSMVVGRQLGSLEAGRHPMPTASGFNYRHSPESMERFWEQIGKETGSSWKVDSDTYMGEEVTQNKAHAWAEPNMRMLWFCATRQ